MTMTGNEGRFLQRPVLRALAVAFLALIVVGAGAMANDRDGSSRSRGRDAKYVVTITNLTYDQIISPPVVVLHDASVQLFEPGQPAIDELAALAEDGVTAPLAGLLSVVPGVADFAVAGGGIPPTGSISVEVRATGNAGLLSLAGMLISTNDAFVGVESRPLPNGAISSRGMTFYAVAYDAGSEANTESCAHIPGPPCGNGGVRVTEGAEGFVHVHRGIHGTGDLDAAAKDWRNPVARITVTRK